ncbi:MAG: hypothetical protein H8E17_02980 [Deltaproteobacteria bacterium]|nr:hypothetical protein [Deltaproteobacteria bacterium]
MPKLKTIKLNKADRVEIDRLQRVERAARCGVQTAIGLHYEAGERLWQAIWRLYPELKGQPLTYHGKGVLTYTPKGKGD